jgi:hypothetical protein
VDPQYANEKSDFLSRLSNFDYWGISFDILRMKTDRFGQLIVDWFASYYNAKLTKFYSRFWNPDCFGIDAFPECWEGQFGLFVSPVIHRVIMKLACDHAH